MDLSYIWENHAGAQTMTRNPQMFARSAQNAPE
jgi:hypothetical protein